MFRTHITVYKCIHVLIVDYEVQVPVPIQIRIGGTVTKTGFIESKCIGFVFKDQVSLVDKCIVRIGTEGIVFNMSVKSNPVSR